MMKITDYSILYVEDEQEIRENYAHFLKNYFVHVYEAADGESAYKLYKEKSPEVLLVDINIPKLNGLELLKKIRQNDQTTRAIVLTSHSDINSLLEAAGLHLTKYLVKPVARNELKDALNLVIKNINDFQIHSNKIVNLKNEYYWNVARCELVGGGEIIVLTKKEKNLLSLFCANLNKTCSYERIIEDVWEYSQGDRINALKTVVKNLRRKIPKNTIENVFGEGYKISS